MPTSRYQYPFEKLRVWQDARVLCRKVYTATAAFPGRETYGMVSQMNRAAVSVAANLAEGSARASARDQAHFSQMAYGSLMETACLAIIALDANLLLPKQEEDLRQDIELVSRQIDSLRKSQLARASGK